MRNSILAAATAFVIGGATTGAIMSQAQPVRPPEATMMPSGPGSEGSPGMMNGPMMGRMHPPAWMHGPHGHPRTFGLFYRQTDRQLTTADVQKIAEAFLLWHGNHSWKVTDVAAAPDGRIAFTYAAGDGTPIAKFAIDPHSGHWSRIG